MTLSSLHFSGTGTHGKTRVVIAKAGYALEETQEACQHPDIEIVGTATSGEELRGVMAAQKPDVVVFGGTFGDGPSPLNILNQLFPGTGKSELPRPGGVVHSSLPENLVKQRAHIRQGDGSNPFSFRHVGTDMPSEALIQAIKEADPYPAPVK